MPTNVYFDTGTRPEQHLYEDLIIEQLRIYGQDVYYIPRRMVSEDELFGEDALSKFEDAYLIEMYVDNNDGYEGEKELMSKFGLDIQDDATFTVSRRRWEQFVSIDNNIIVSLRPNEGDLVYWPKGNKLFEITFVDHDDPFYQVHNLPTYKLKCKTFEYGSEDIDTGIAQIDSIETENSLDQLEYQVSLEQNGTFNENFSLEDSTGLIIQEASGSGDNLLSEDETHSGSLQVENSVQGADASYIVQETYKVDTIDANAMNDFFDREEDAILDFTESNPFGDAGK
tara:strand:- start:1637 stop:2488 length:852 start_codon:yes stop_codon:yes gene_type:complete